MSIKCAAIVKNILDRNGCNYQLEKKLGEVTFLLDNQYNELFEDCPMYLSIAVERHNLSIWAVLKNKIQGEAQVPVSKLLSRINKDLSSSDEINIRVEWDMEKGIIYMRYVMPYLRCPDELDLRAIMSIPLIFMCAIGEWIIATAHGELSVEEAFEAIRNNMQEGKVNKGFLEDDI